MTNEQSKKEKDTIIVLAPGRICFFGDHQDYLGLPVIAGAINRYITLKARPNSLETFSIHLPDIKGELDINIHSENKIEESEHHFKVALRVLRKYGCIPNKGYDITISSNIPINAGISSSSAVVTSWIKFLLEAFGCDLPITPDLTSKLAYQTEVLEQGSPGGKMDQYSIGLGTIMYLETGDTLYYELFKKQITGLIIAESGIPKKTLGVLGELREKAQLAIHKVKEKLPGFQINKAGKKDLQKYLNYVPQDLKVYLKAAILNHDITQQALKEFRKKNTDINRIGNLMNDHHSILKNYLQITVPKIDNMIDSACSAGALGAKIVGSGKGGCIVVIAPEGEEPIIIQALIKAGAKDAYQVKIDSGARIVRNKNN